MKDSMLIKRGMKNNTHLQIMNSPLTIGCSKVSMRHSNDISSSPVGCPKKQNWSRSTLYLL